MGTAQVGEVQPAPIPVKTVPAVGFTCTRTVDPQVSVTPQVTHKPVQVCHYSCFFMDLSPVFFFFKTSHCLFLCIVPIVQYCNYIVKYNYLPYACERWHEGVHAGWCGGDSGSRGRG